MCSLHADASNLAAPDQTESNAVTDLVGDGNRGSPDTQLLEYLQPNQY